VAFERIGLGGILRFDDKQALAGMQRATAGFAKLQSGVGKLGAGFSMIGDSMRNAGLAMLPITAGLGFGAKKAADFEKQMSAVGAITRSSADELAALSNEAKRQGVVSVFSAQQSAEAMEFMGRAGFNTKEIIDGLGGVMAAAAADGISLATSSDIVARVVKGMGLEVKEASHVADVLALTSAKTNTNITALGEAFTYGAPQAKALGISLEETTAAFGLMADAGLRGSLGGTSFMNMLVKLSKPSTKATAMINNMGIKLEDAHGRLKPLPEIIGMFKKELDKVQSTTKKAAMMAEIFGLRGAKAYSALSLAGREKMAQLTEDLEASSFGLGAAQEMANQRLDNFLGALTLFGSSLEAVAIEFFGPFLNVFKETTQDMTAALNSVLFAVQGLKQIREQAALSAVKAAKRESTAIVEQQKVLAGLQRREQATAKAGIAAIQTRIIGEEKLTREQQRARSRSFAEFVKGNLAREKLTKAQRKSELKAIDAFIQANEQGNLTAAQRVQMEKRYLQTLVTLGAKGKKLGQAEAARRAANLENLINQRAEAAKFEAAAEAVIVRQEKLTEIEEKHGRTARLIAEGVLEAIDQIKSGFQTAVQMVRDFGTRFGEAVGSDRMKEFARIATIGVVVAGALAPVFLGLSAIGFVIKSVFLPQIMGVYKILAAFKPVVSGLLGVVRGLMAAAFWPLAVAIGVVGGAFLLLRKQGESVSDTFWRLVGVVEDFIDPFISWRREGETTFEAIKRGILELPKALMFWRQEGETTFGAIGRGVQSVIDTLIFWRQEGESTLDALSRGLWGVVDTLIFWRQEGESTIGALTRGFGLLVEGARQLWAGGIKPFLIDAWAGVVSVVQTVGNVLMGVWDQVQIAWSEFGVTEKIKANFMLLVDIAKTVANAVGGVVTTVLETVKTVVWPFVSGFVSGFVSALSPIVTTWFSIWDSVVQVFAAVWGTIKSILQVFSDTWTELVDLFIDDSDRSSTKWSELGQTIGQVAAWLVDTFGGLLNTVVGVVKEVLIGVTVLIRGLVGLFGFFAKVAGPTLLLPFKALWDGAKGVASGIVDLFKGDFSQGIKKIFVALVDVILLPFRMIMKAIVQLTKAAPGLMSKFVSPETAAKLDRFAKFGFAGPPKKTKQTVDTVVQGAEDASKVISLEDERRRRDRDKDVAKTLAMPELKIPGMPAVPKPEGRVIKMPGVTVAPQQPVEAVEKTNREQQIFKMLNRAGVISSRQTASRVSDLLSETNKELTKENVLAARKALDTVAERRRKEAKDREKAAEKELQANVKVEDKRKLDITNKMCVDGEAASVATARHKRNVFERNGATHEPYLQKMSTETGVRMAGNSRS